MGTYIELPVDSVVFREDLYPRLSTNPVKVQDYCLCLDALPPIEINQDNILIDGWHRWTAHKKAATTTIKAAVTVTKNDAEIKEFAVIRNAIHGLQLSLGEKQAYARERYRETPMNERGTQKKQLAKMLSVRYETINNWLSRIDKDENEQRNATIFALWLSCHTQEEIAEAVGVTQRTISNVLEENERFKILLEPGIFSEIKDDAEKEKSIIEHNRNNAEHRKDFTPPLYNIWKQQEKTPGANHYGNSEIRWVDNLLYLYTQPFDVVVDPFAGSGSTIDICKKRFRRYWVSDRKPIVEREKEIRKWDITEGLPPLSRWKDVKLVYLDPPYWKQAEGKYSNDPDDLANMPLEQFNEILSGLIKSFSRKISDAYIALIIQPTQWNAPERTFTDHIADMLRLVNLPVEMRYSVPYESQQCNAQMVEWAKTNKRCLVLTREIIVWQVL